MFGMNEKVGRGHFKSLNEDQLLVTSIFYTIQGEGPFRGHPALFVRLAKCQLACSFCFVGNTKILMGDGTRKNIDQINVDDLVMSWSGESFEPKKVTRTYSNVTEKLLRVSAGGKKVWVTPEHPFLTSNRGWVNAEDLVKGDVLVNWSSSDQMKMFNPSFDPSNRTPLSQEARWGAARDEKWIDKRRKLFQKHGFETLFLPLGPKDIKNNNHSNIREMVSRFIHNGAVVNSVEECSPYTYARYYGSVSAPRTVYNIEVEDNHTYVANSFVVHNCDTYFDSGSVMTFDEILETAQERIEDFYHDRNMTLPKFAQSYDREVKLDNYQDPVKIPTLKKIVFVVTGGEPTLQTNLVKFLDKVHESYYCSQIESNGVLHLDGLSEKTTVVISPKCIELKGVATKYIKPPEKVLNYADCLKFVVCAPDPEGRYTPYEEVPQWAIDWSERTGNPLFVSPMNIYLQEPQKAKELRAEKEEITLDERSTVDEVISFWQEGLLDMKANQRNHEYAAELAMKVGAILQLQIHLYASLA